MGKADIHIHTTYSDGCNTVRDVLKYAAEYTNLDVIAITDHDTINGALEAQQLASRFGIDVIVGEEISTAQGHLLALFIERHIPPGQSLEATIKVVHAQGGLCIAAHPFGLLVPSVGRAGALRRCVDLGQWQLDGIESLNASLWSPINNYQAAATAADLGLASCGGSDSHHLTTIGSGYTLFPGHSVYHLREAIQCGLTEPGGHFWGWNEVMMATGPFIRRELRGLARAAVGAK